MIALDTIRTHAADPDRPALIGDGVRLTWGQYAHLVERLAAGLAQRLKSAGPGAAGPLRAALIAENSAEYVVLASAFATLGLPFLGLDPAASADVLRHQLAALQPGVLAADLDALPRARAWLDEAHMPAALLIELQGEWRGAASRAKGALSLTELTASAGEAANWTRPPSQAFSFTSGTTGLPKLMVRTAPSEARRLAVFKERYHFSRDDTHLVTVPFSHASGHGWARTFLSVGAGLILPPSDAAERQVGLIEEHRVRTTLMVPPVLARFVTAAEQEAADLSSLRFVLTGGRQLSPSLLARATRRLGPVITLYYGTTETGVNLVADAHELARHPLTSGSPLPGNEVRILGADRQPLAAGQVGRVALSSFMSMDGYLTRPTDEVELGGARFLITADHGWLDESGRLFLLNRDDGLPGGAALPVIPAEAALHELSGVQDAALIRTPQQDQAPRIVAALVLGPHADEPQVRARASGLLNEFFPGTEHEVAAVPAIPYSRTGKVQTGPLLDLLAQQARHPKAGLAR